MFVYQWSFTSQLENVTTSFFLCSVSIVVLVVENSVSMGRSMGTDNVSENGSEHCRDNMKSEVMDPCAPCSQFDVVC